MLSILCKYKLKLVNITVIQTDEKYQNRGYGKNISYINSDNISDNITLQREVRPWLEIKDAYQKNNNSKNKTWFASIWRYTNLWYNIIRGW